MSKRIIFTGGGSAGHVTVNMALIPQFQDMGWDVKYIGSENGIEAQLIQKLSNVEYIPISTGKLRRYFDKENFKDPFRIIKGVHQAYQIIRREKPNVVFSKGGFVSVPVVLGAWLNRVPVVIHESDISPGLANKLSIPFAAKVCLTFTETKEYINSNKSTHIGPIIRKELRQGNANKGYSLCDFTKSKPVILIMGGSLGSKRINETVRKNLNHLLSHYQIVHICGKGQLDESIKLYGYKQFEYVHEELPDLLAMADFVISRAGSNSIFEFLALHKPMLLIPLSLGASRGDQILNAKSFKKSGYCEVLFEEQLNDDSFMTAISTLVANRQTIVDTMIHNVQGKGTEELVHIIESVSK
ncbi:undecaprenyldiphospho-muramoylpentapeptide beta-N-acetylglucosaminyltransferase [Paenibacillus sediminis]|uniref:UDP-N-acetylglucosamine--N-acetylmuramyl-(pentapeptide) pyrophosphoryl-undecaprenol N-acetylglucosamine transferase n=1 Tax=Paenibacillus sediminis TaxID=664909 RepID=A0ABS4H1Z7_9BACL|nr:undecaprenyldiphospho-muramoylpentapeptide beta-N-acetylglucosaminyltransferase [Paenibacillus sediminis]MBP1936556.1 UDP-N-acetylglucosamine--N-acetylmuramyl-(pentapeptide) pyrophosphoryl-undecaprenol N-acetylglucosamine transferase [Paenibacillus sediminis]